MLLLLFLLQFLLLSTSDYHSLCPFFLLYNSVCPVFFSIMSILMILLLCFPSPPLFTFSRRTSSLFPLQTFSLFHNSPFFSYSLLFYASSFFFLCFFFISLPPPPLHLSNIHIVQSWAEIRSI